MSKSLYFIGSSFVLGIGAYAAYKYYKSRDSKCIDEGFEDTNKSEDNPIKKILVLGLENSGKSTIISKLAQNETIAKPTEGFNVTQLETENTVFNLWEVGGKENVRKYWLNFLQDTDLLVYVVDSSDLHNLPLAVKELRTIMGDERMNHVPVIVVASKNDLPGAMHVQEVAEAIDVLSIESYKHKVKVLRTEIGATNSNAAASSSGDHNDSINVLKKAIIAMSQ